MVGLGKNVLRGLEQIADRRRFCRDLGRFLAASFLGEVWDSYGGRFADVKLVIPAACTAD